MEWSEGSAQCVVLYKLCISCTCLLTASIGMSTSRRTERAKITLWSIMYLREEEGKGERGGRRRRGGGWEDGRGGGGKDGRGGGGEDGRGGSTDSCFR